MLAVGIHIYLPLFCLGGGRLVVIIVDILLAGMSASCIHRRLSLVVFLFSLGVFNLFP